MKIHLSSSVIAALYKDSLVLPDEKSEQTTVSISKINNKISNTSEHSPPDNKKWFLGDNKKNIIILIKDETEVFINDESLATLSKLLSACKFNLEDVAIINHSRYNISFNELKEQLQPKHLFLFDVSMQDIHLPFTIPHYQVQRYAGCCFMTASPITLSTGNTSNTEKTKLWEKLKIIFSI